jgi:uncharacterized protein involved in exopolysaccharide biosynthesis
MWKDVKWAVAISPLAALVVIGYGLYQVPRYEATATVLVGVDSPAPPTAPSTRVIEAGLKGQSGGKIQLIPNASPDSLQEISHRVTVALHSRAVAEETIRRLGLKMSPAELLHNLTVEDDPGTMFIRLTYTDTDPARARLVVNTVGQVVREHVMGGNAMDGYAITATLWEPAKLPATPASPHPLRNGLITLVITLMLSTVVVAVREYRRGNYS